jgi:OPT family oligopeptide transporter
MRNGDKPAAPAELTVRAILLGIFLALVFGAANTYLAMRAGQTVSATIPAAVVALALARVWGGTVQEQNTARTSASVGEALIAGAAFTIPAFLFAGIWKDLQSHYWEASFIMLTGGLIGTFFIIVLRRPLCVDAGLPWPESVASAEMVRASESSAEAPKYIFGAAAFAGFLQALKTGRGLGLIEEYFEGFWAFPPSVVRHFDFDKKTLAEVPYRGGVPWSTPALSPALMGIGYIIGPQLASINVAGGILAWWVMIPLLLFFDPDLATRLGGPAVGPDVQAYTVWYNIVRPIAVGMMLVAACNTLFRMRDSLVASIKGAIAASSSAVHSGAVVDRTDRDIPLRWTMIGIVAMLIPITAIYFYFTQSMVAALIAAAVMTVTGFLLSAAGGYLCGLVGGSNQPLSGLTLTALVITALLLVALGIRGPAGVGAVLGVAAVVACACSVSGSLIQDLKAGHLLQATPWKMQVVEIGTVILVSFFLMFPLMALHQANLDTGGIGGRALPAPQAGLMAQMAQGIVGGQMAWGLLGIGIAFGLAMLLCGARAPMLIAVGMYIPFDTSSAIFLGGVMRWVADKISSNPQQVEDKGTLLASGLIAGEAIMAMLLAVASIGGLALPSFTGLEAIHGPMWIVTLAAVAFVLVRIPSKGRT